MLSAADDGSGIAPHFLNLFYYTFISYLIDAGIDDDEDEEVIFPRGYLPIMTIHQSKGLEFPFVIVAQVTGGTSAGAAQTLENILTPFRQDLYPRITRSAADLAIEDAIRLYYVAYSRAQHGLMIVATDSQLKDSIAIPGKSFTEFRRKINRPMS
jgi:DNA helicase-2/ATP-dependent DNA helicase PcrA